jgi:hypothetical protein
LPVKQVTDQVQTLLDNLKKVFPSSDTTGIDPDTFLSKLFEAINTSGDLARIHAGEGKTTSSATDAQVTTVATANGATIDLLPRDTLQLAPVATIQVGASTNTLTLDRANRVDGCDASTACPGKATVDFDPAIVRITLADDIAATLSAVPNPIELAPGQSFCIPLPDPLESCITVAGGSSTTEADGGTLATASAVSIQLLDGLPGGGITLDLATTRVEGLAIVPADVNREAPPAETAPPPPEDAPLARTGGTTNGVLVASLLGLAVAGYYLPKLARRRNSSA